MPMKPKEMEKFLRKHGFKEIRTRGDHRFYRNDKTKRTTVVPVAKKELGVGIQHKILKEAGLK